MISLKKVKSSPLGKILKWGLRAFLSWRWYFKQLFWSYKYYRTKKHAIACDINCGIKYVGEKRVKFPHPVGIVIGLGVVVGDSCTFFQNTTCGTKYMKYGNDYPSFGNNVIVGASAVVVGNISIGNNVTIGALTLVDKDVPDNAIVVGNPMKIIGFNKVLDE